MVTIIGICGISGAGKTTLVKALSKALKATALFWDDYDDISTGPYDYVKWYETSRDYAAWDYSALESVLSQLKDEQKVLCPATKKALLPTPYVIFDAPLGYKHTQTGKFIDKLIYLEVPLDVALARRILRDSTPKTDTKNILEELEHYLSFSRKVYDSSSEVKEGCHLLLNAQASVEEQIQLTISSLRL